MPWSLPTPPSVTGPYVFGATDNAGNWLFAARTGDTIYSTDDGVTWSAGANPLGGTCYGCAYQNGRWFIFGDDSNDAAIAYSATVNGFGAPSTRMGPTGASFIHFAGDGVDVFGFITNEATPVLHYTLDDLFTAWATMTATAAFNPQFLTCSLVMGETGSGFYSGESGSTHIRFFGDVSGAMSLVTGNSFGYMGAAPTADGDYIIFLGESVVAQLDVVGLTVNTLSPPAPGIQLDKVFTFNSGAIEMVALSSFDADVLLYSDDNGETYAQASGPAHAFTSGIGRANGALFAWGDGLITSPGDAWYRLENAETGAPASYSEIGGAVASNGTAVFIYNQDAADIIVVRHAPGDTSVAATIPVTSALVGTLRKIHDLSGSIDAVSTLAGDLESGKFVAGTIAVASSLIGAVSLDLGFAGTASATSSLTASATISSANVAVPTVGLIEGLTDAVGAVDNEIGGIVATRLTVAGLIGETTISVETTLGWPSTAGKLSIDGIVYRYTALTDTTFSGITHIAGGVTVAGLKKKHSKQSTVLDLSQTRSALDKVRRAMLVDYAEGEDLNVIGRNLGVLRPPALSDDARFREIIKAIAYNPRGTIYGIELALTGIVGAGNFDIFEDLVSQKCKVFISLKNEALASNKSAGKTYLSGSYFKPLSGASNDELDLTGDTLLGRLKRIQGVRLRDEDITTPTRVARPSAHLISEYTGDTPRPAWLYGGVTAENTNVTLVADDGGVTRFAITTANAAYYRRTTRLQPESDADLHLTMSIPTGTTLNTDANQFTIEIWDGFRKLRIGFVHVAAGTYSVGFSNDSALGAFIAGAAITLNKGTYYEIGVQKRGEWAHLVVDGHIVQTLPRASFPVSGTTVSQCGFASYVNGSATVGPVVRLSSLRLWATTPTDYWANRNTTGSVQTTDPERFTTGVAGVFVDDPVGKQIRITGSAITNAQGGNNNGRFLIKTQLTDQVVVLEGHPHKKLSTNVSNPTRVVTAERLFKFPDDLGKKVVISGSALGNDGTFVINALRDDISLVDLSTQNTKLPVWTNVAELTGAAFQTETDLEWRLDPNFQIESGLTWELSDAGRFITPIVKLPKAAAVLPVAGFPAVYELFVTEVLSAQLLEDNTLDNMVIETTPEVLYEYYPFYLADPLGIVRVFLDELTAAGVLPEYLLT